MRTSLLLATFLLWVIQASSQYNILNYGADKTGRTLSTAAINKAISECNRNGGGRVVMPAGIYRSGTIIMKDKVELYLESGAVLKASTDRKDFPRQPQPVYRSHKDKGGWFALIYAEGASQISITGLGTIDGSGAEQKPDPNLFGGDLDGRPRNILFISCQDIRVEGITMLNSGMWNQHYLNCEDLIIDRVKVYNHSNRNNDAIDIDGCRRVTLSNSIFDTDDDGITLKSTGPAPAEDIVITNCIVSSFCNAIKAGTESSGGFRNITISNCVIKPSRSRTRPVFNTPRIGITGISLEIVDGGKMEGVTISNINMEGTECPLYIRLGNRARKYREDMPEPQMGTMKNISISNIVAYNTGNFSSSITGVPGAYVENVQLSNIQFYHKGGLKPGDYLPTYQEVSEDEKGYPQPTVWGNLPSSFLFIRHVKNLQVNGYSFGSVQTDPRIPVIAVDVQMLQLRGGSYIGTEPNNRPFALLHQVSHPVIEAPLNWKGKTVQID
ncbi:MAG TPA: glycosyl hydrolase family 28-related protein [Flavihumibacter sp.]